MDEQWVVERLEWWIATAREARVRGQYETYAYTRETARQYQSLRDVSAQTEAIIVRVLGRASVPDLLDRAGDKYYLNTGIELAEQALAVVKTQAETRSKLGTSAPTMKADALHPTVWTAAAKRWESGHYSDAVQRAATALSGHIKDLTGRYELGDSELVAQAFSPQPAVEGKPRLRWPGKDDDLTVRSMRVGILNVAQGAFAAIRNTATHTTEELPKQEALEQLATLSMLARWIDRCEVERVS